MQVIDVSPPIGSTPDPAITLAERYKQAEASGEPISAPLRVDDRVLARVTDGIYRRPSAALRELVFNAYDADATKVVIDTDAPRFQRMSIRDNGIGMDERALADLITHIGGSSKRTRKGVEVGTVNPDNPEQSPAGRALIGKIGIGLFAVVHLTTNFRIITKRKGSVYRLVADVQMKTHTEEAYCSKPLLPEGKEEFIAGEVSLWRESASDPEAHGTEVVLLDLRRTTRDILRDASRWEAILEEQAAVKASPTSPNGSQVDREIRLHKPQFHIGFINSEEPFDYLVDPVVPWGQGLDAEKKFRSLYQKIVESTGITTRSPDLEYFFDQYLETLWRLSLAAPLPYLDEHPLRLRGNTQIDIFMLQNRMRGQADALSIDSNQTLDGTLLLQSVSPDPCGGFSVLIDGIELRRPVVLADTLLEGKNAKKALRAKRPMLFVGQCTSSLGSYPSDQSGGPLEFEAYFYWNSLIVPNQNRGVLVRIHGASGVLYDEKFMDYQTAELNRLKQITAEVFILKGMDPALNIDRESFNISHPHYQYLAKWVHSAIRQITNVLKGIGKRGIDAEKTARTVGALASLGERVEAIWLRRGDELSGPPEITILGQDTPQQQLQLQLRAEGGMAFQLPGALLRQAANPGKAPAPAPAEQAKAIMATLLAYGLLDGVPYSRQQELFEDIVSILLTGRLP